jgi:glycosyltransferase involved in cell wall biosynthesis
MTVLSIAFALLPVSADSGGGSEQILWQIERGLVVAGHRSIVVAAEGSRITGCLMSTPAADGEITDKVRAVAHRAHREAIQRVLDTHQVDLLHFHGLDFAEYVPAVGPPMLTTLHLPVAWYPKHIFDIPGLSLNFVSRSQAAANHLPYSVPVICNGIDLNRYRPAGRKKSFALVLSRICPEKGIDVALRLAHRLDFDLVIAGPVHPFASHQAYFNEQIAPLLDNRRRYVGPVGGGQKQELLASAKCLLAPSVVAETSSLVAMEAIASGTPVIAFRSGALPEVVDDRITGFIVDSEDGMADAVQRVNQLHPDRCRTVATERFDSRRMVDEYLKLYQRLL